MYKTKAYATASATSPLASTTIPRRDPTDRDVQIEILFCGICHSDLHYARDEWHDVMPTVYPCVPGHEIVGRVTKVGSGVSKFKADDLVGVGCLVDSDHTCPSCQAGLQQFCPNQVLTYGSPDRHKTAAVTYGGYSDSIVVDEGFVLRIPANLNLAGAAPLLCAGITTYSPMRHWGVTKGKKVGVVGLGGLGHVGVKIAKAMGAEVTVLSQSLSKKDDAGRLGASQYYATSDPETFTTLANNFDIMINTVTAPLDLPAFLSLLGLGGVLNNVGAPPQKMHINRFSVLKNLRIFTGSMIGSNAETQEMLDFCGQHRIGADIETIPVGKINEAYGRIMKSDVRYRFVIDIATLNE